MVRTTHKLFNGTRISFEAELHGDNYEFHRCGNCGIEWGLPEWFLNERREDGIGWLCPNGHSFVYNKGLSKKELVEAELRRTKDKLAAARARADQTEASLRATKGVVTRQKKRLEKVVAGVCPVDGCKRHFKDLRRHISTKHPDYHAQS
jgi:hypothetical protein